MQADSLPVIQFVDESVAYPGNGGNFSAMDLKMEGGKRSASDAGFEESDSGSEDALVGSMLHHPGMQGPGAGGLKAGKKTKGRVKIKMEFIENKLRRYTTFSKRKTGIMKKAYELSTLTGTQVMLLVASETGHVYTFATRKLQPMITSESGKALIQTCLNSPDPPPSTPGQQHAVDQRMNPTGFEETELSYAVGDEEGQKSESPSPMHPSQMQKPMAAVYGTQAQMPLNLHANTPSPAPSMQPSPSPSPQQISTTPQQTITVGGSYFSAPSSSTPSKQPLQAQQQTMSMQLPTGGIAVIPQAAAGLPPGTPITLGPIGGQQVAGQSTQQAIYRIPTQQAGGQVVSIPGYTSIAQPSQGKASDQTHSLGSQSQPNVTVMSAVVPNGSTTTSPPGTIMYQTPQGVVYAAPTTAVSALPEGYILNLPQLTQSDQQQQGQGAPQQYITIPVPISLAGGTPSMIQPIIAQPNVTTSSQSDIQRMISSHKSRK